MDRNNQLENERGLVRLKDALAEGIRQAESGEIEPLTFEDLIEELNQGN